VNQKIESAHAILKDVGKRIGSVPVPVDLRIRFASTGTGYNMNFPELEYNTLRNVIIL
jgi:hypothetical protein